MNSSLSIWQVDAIIYVCMHWKYKEVLHIHGDVKVAKTNKKIKKSITSSWRWHPGAECHSNMTRFLSSIWKKKKTWMFKSWFVVTAKIHKTFWSISSACRETIMVLFCFEEDIYCVFWVVLFFNDLSPGLSDISKRESLPELYSFELLWCRKLCLFVEFLGFLSR